MPLLVYVVVIRYKDSEVEDYIVFEHFAEAAEHIGIVLDKEGVINVEIKKVVYV